MDILILALALLAILIGAELFTNGVEWAGHKLGLAEGAVGSVLAAVGTALPETMIPLIAILVTGVAVLVVRRGQPAGAPMPVDVDVIAWDMRWQRTPILVEEQHGGADCHLTRTSKDGAELIIASLARRYWYGQALQVPWVRTACPK